MTEEEITIKMKEHDLTYNQAVDLLERKEKFEALVKAKKTPNPSAHKVWI